LQLYWEDEKEKKEALGWKIELGRGEKKKKREKASSMRLSRNCHAGKKKRRKEGGGLPRPVLHGRKKRNQKKPKEK